MPLALAPSTDLPCLLETKQMELPSPTHLLAVLLLPTVSLPTPLPTPSRAGTKNPELRTKLLPLLLPQPFNQVHLTQTLTANGLLLPTKPSMLVGPQAQGIIALSPSQLSKRLAILVVGPPPALALLPLLTLPVAALPHPPLLPPSMASVPQILIPSH